ncbi:hypothetical protein Tco_0289025, partial [Tanacetum coccineum]
GPHCRASDAQPVHLRDLNGQQPAASNNKSFSWGSRHPKATTKLCPKFLESAIMDTHE